jgi:transcription termination factor Rho
LVELGGDVVIVLDSLTRLARAFGPGNTAGRPPDYVSVAKPKRYFGSARACEEGGSLTLIAVATVDGASAFDAVLVEEAAAIASCEYVVSAELARGGAPVPIDLRVSATRDAELLLAAAEAKGARELRAAFGTRTVFEVAASLADGVASGR